MRAAVIAASMLAVCSCMPSIPASRRAPPDAAGNSASGRPTPAMRDAGAAADATAPARDGAAVRSDAAADTTTATGDAVAVDATAAGNDAGGARAGGAVADASPEAPLARMPAPAELVITEVLANPAGQDLGREWIELENRAGVTLDVSALHVADTTTDVALALGTVAPGAIVVLAQSGDPSKNGGVRVDAVYGTRLMLNNEGERIALCVGACATGVVLSSVAWGMIGGRYDGHAIVVAADGQMCPATEPFGTAGDFGTPGAANAACAPTDVDAAVDSGTAFDAASDVQP